MRGWGILINSTEFIVISHRTKLSQVIHYCWDSFWAFIVYGAQAVCNTHSQFLRYWISGSFSILCIDVPLAFSVSLFGHPFGGCAMIPPKDQRFMTRSDSRYWWWLGHLGICTMEVQLNSRVTVAILSRLSIAPPATCSSHVTAYVCCQ